jgi:hypothetical protein
MKIQDIANIEDANDDGIILFREGLFWRAYERSAFRFNKFIKEYRVLSREYKNIGRKLVFSGFPGNQLDKILKICYDQDLKADQSKDGLIRITSLNPLPGFQEWKDIEDEYYLVFCMKRELPRS